MSKTGIVVGGSARSEIAFFSFLESNQNRKFSKKEWPQRLDRTNSMTSRSWFLEVFLTKSSIYCQGVKIFENFQKCQKCSQYPRVPIGTRGGTQKVEFGELEHPTFFFVLGFSIFTNFRGLYL